MKSVDDMWDLFHNQTADSRAGHDLNLLEGEARISFAMKWESSNLHHIRQFRLDLLDHFDVDFVLKSIQKRCVEIKVSVKSEASKFSNAISSEAFDRLAFKYRIFLLKYRFDNIVKVIHFDFPGLHRDSRGEEGKLWPRGKTSR